TRATSWSATGTASSASPATSRPRWPPRPWSRSGSRNSCWRRSRAAPRCAAPTRRTRRRSPSTAPAAGSRRSARRRAGLLVAQPRDGALDVTPHQLLHVGGAALLHRGEDLVVLVELGAPGRPPLPQQAHRAGPQHYLPAVATPYDH